MLCKRFLRPHIRPAPRSWPPRYGLGVTCSEPSSHHFALLLANCVGLSPLGARSAHNSGLAEGQHRVVVCGVLGTGGCAPWGGGELSTHTSGFAKGEHRVCVGKGWELVCVRRVAGCNARGATGKQGGKAKLPCVGWVGCLRSRLCGVGKHGSEAGGGTAGLCRRGLLSTSKSCSASLGLPRLALHLFP